MKGPLHAIRRRRSERPANGVDTTQAAAARRSRAFSCSSAAIRARRSVAGVWADATDASAAITISARRRSWRSQTYRMPSRN